MISSRRYDLDWLRIIAFGILIYFHTAIFFVPGGLPMIQNAETSPTLAVFVEISSQFRLSLLFFISGVGVAFARRRRSNKQFIAERSKRLLIPLAVAVLLIVPPMVYLEKLFLGDYTGSFIEFYPLFFTQGVYPTGNLSWHHLWFIVYLYLFCLIGVKVFHWMETTGQERMQNWVQQAQGLGIYRFVLPLFVVELLLRAVFPGARDLIHDWASFSHWLLIFLAGYVVANNAAILDNAAKLSSHSITIAIVATLSMYALFGGFSITPDFDDPLLLPKYVLFCALRMVMVWASLLTCLGLAAKYLRFNHPALGYLNEAVYPLFILHLTVITALGYWVVDLSWSLPAKYLFITSLTATVVLLSYHYAIRPFNGMRLLFGVKPKLQNINADVRSKVMPSKT